MSLKDTIIEPLEVGCTNDERAIRNGNLVRSMNVGGPGAYEGRQTIDYAEFVLCQSQSNGAESPQYQNLEQPNIIVVITPSRTETTINSVHQGPNNNFNSPLGEDPFREDNDVLHRNSPSRYANGKVRTIQIRPDQNPTTIIKKHPNEMMYAYIVSHATGPSQVFPGGGAQSKHSGTNFDSPTHSTQLQNGAKANVLFTKVKIHNI